MGGLEREDQHGAFELVSRRGEGFWELKNVSREAEEQEVQQREGGDSTAVQPCKGGDWVRIGRVERMTPERQRVREQAHL